MRSADFHGFEGDALPSGIRVYGGWEDAGTRTPTYPVSENLVTAEEGDTRDWDGYSEEVRVGDLGKNGLKPVCDSVRAGAGFSGLSRLKITTADGLDAAGSCYETLYGFGGRGISVFTADGKLVSTTGDELERVTAAALPSYFSSDHGTSSFDNRSDDKGPEPEGVALGEVGGRTYAFVGPGSTTLFDVAKAVRTSR